MAHLFFKEACDKFIHMIRLALGVKKRQQKKIKLDGNEENYFNNFDTCDNFFSWFSIQNQ